MSSEEKAVRVRGSEALYVCRFMFAPEDQTTCFGEREPEPRVAEGKGAPDARD